MFGRCLSCCLNTAPHLRHRLVSRVEPALCGGPPRTSRAQPSIISLLLEELQHNSRQLHTLWNES
jgi:hypothetical protein